MGNVEEPITDVYTQKRINGNQVGWGKIFPKQSYKPKVPRTIQHQKNWFIKCKIVKRKTVKT